MQHATELTERGLKQALAVVESEVTVILFHRAITVSPEGLDANAPAVPSEGVKLTCETVGMSLGCMIRWHGKPVLAYLVFTVRSFVPVRSLAYARNGVAVVSCFVDQISVVCATRSIVMTVNN